LVDQTLGRACKIHDYKAKNLQYILRTRAGLIPDEGPSVETSNMFYRLGSEIILPALVRYAEVLPTLATCVVV
jgi:hypothetical protein